MLMNILLCKYGLPCLSRSYLFTDPAYVVAPVLPSRSGREDLKKLFAGLSSYPCTKCLVAASLNLSIVIFFIITWQIRH